ncbi:MAG: glycosyltransferase family 2 protein [Burkholderiales bacterium]
MEREAGATTSRSTKIAVVIAAYNEAATVRAVAMRALSQVLHVIVVDDGSEDRTQSELKNLSVDYLRNAKNLGKAASLWRGFEHALERDASAVITLDADGQHLPEDIPKLITAHRTCPDCIVIGARPHEKKDAPARRYYANRFADFWIGWAAGQRISDSQSGFRLYPTKVLRRVTVNHRKAAGFVFESEILIVAARQGFKIISVPVPALYGERRSHFRPVLDILRIARMIGWKLLSRGLYFRGLISSRSKSRALLAPGSTGQLDGKQSTPER